MWPGPMVGCWEQLWEATAKTDLVQEGRVPDPEMSAQVAVLGSSVCFRCFHLCDQLWAPPLGCHIMVD